jgi:hypothetical protein
MGCGNWNPCFSLKKGLKPHENAVNVVQKSVGRGSADPWIIREKSHGSAERRPTAMVDLLALPQNGGMIVPLKALRRMFFEKSGIETGLTGRTG